MFHNRIRRFLRSAQRRTGAPAARTLAALPAFAMQGGVAEIYRLAREQAEQQIASKRAARRQRVEWN